MSDHPDTTWSRVSGIELAEIEVLMLIKGVPPERLGRILDSKGATKLEQLDWLTVGNFLHYLRSL